jgi:hypothetical protein
MHSRLLPSHVAVGEEGAGGLVTVTVQGGEGGEGGEVVRADAQLRRGRKAGATQVAEGGKAVGEGPEEGECKVDGASCGAMHSRNPTEREWCVQASGSCGWSARGQVGPLELCVCGNLGLLLIRRPQKLCCFAIAARIAGTVECPHEHELAMLLRRRNFSRYKTCPPTPLHPCLGVSGRLWE